MGRAAARVVCIAFVVAMTRPAGAEGTTLSPEARQRRFACVCDMCNHRALDVCACKRAEEMRLQLGLIVARQSNEVEIDEAMVEMYGGSVLGPTAEPTSSKDVPWLGPFVFAALAAGTVWRIGKTIRRRRARL
jgi:cytochrome c-type biogenesis protein CcmH/NrfF